MPRERSARVARLLDQPNMLGVVERGTMGTRVRPAVGQKAILDRLVDFL
ncbi:MAG: hypothetical protein ACREF4_08245 [Gammaproteobacteria bacterium]